MVLEESVTTICKVNLKGQIIPLVVLCEYNMMKDLVVHVSYTKMRPDATNCDFTF
jgi:hypothetical protein